MRFEFLTRYWVLSMSGLPTVGSMSSMTVAACKLTAGAVGKQLSDLCICAENWTPSYCVRDDPILDPIPSDCCRIICVRANEPEAGSRCGIWL